MGSRIRIVCVRLARHPTGTALYTKEQRVWNATKKTLERLSEKVQPPDLKGFQKILYEFLEGESYEIFITTIIILNACQRGSTRVPPPPAWIACRSSTRGDTRAACMRALVAASLSLNTPTLLS